MSDNMSYTPPPPPPPVIPPPAPPSGPTLPPPNPNQYDFAKPFTFVFDDPRWMNKILIGGLFQLAAILIIGWFFVLGYCAQLARNVVSGQQHPLPEWDDLGGLFNDGARLIGVGLVYTLPFIVIALMFMIPSIAMSATDNEVANMLGGTIVSCLWCLIVPASMALMFFMPASLLFATMEQRFGAAFEFRRIWPFIKNNIGNYLLAIVVYLIADFVGGFGIMLLCIGVFFTTFWAVVVKTYAFAQVYRLATLPKP